VPLWGLGLITAAKAVASATTALVTEADGVVTGGRTMEALVVAAHEVRSLSLSLPLAHTHTHKRTVWTTMCIYARTLP
jgi:hypothetical protein